MKKKYSCEIDCANCAAKVEEAVRKIDGVHDVRVNFMTQKFTLDADDESFDRILEQAVECGKRIDSDFSVKV